MGREVLDEWEIADIDRDEQKRGLERRKRRWKEIELEEKKIRNMKKKAIKKAEQIKRMPNLLEIAWLKCDFILHNIMEKDAYKFMYDLTSTDPNTYKHLYKIFMSPYMMERADYFVEYFRRGGKAPDNELIPLSRVVKYYKQYKGIKDKITVIHKGEKSREL